ncbi:MAG: cation:proton antiporter, partial [Flavobacterium sp.]
IIGLERKKGFSASFVYNLHKGYLKNRHINVLVYHAAQPIATVKDYTVLIPAHAEKEAGFFHSLLRIWNISRNSGAKMNFYASREITEILKSIKSKVNIEASFMEIASWDEAEMAAEKVGEDTGLILMMANRGMDTYSEKMQNVPDMLNKSFSGNNYILIYPFSTVQDTEVERRAVSNHQDFAEIGNMISAVFRA